MTGLHEKDDWQARFRRDGYAVFAGLCPQPLVHAARSAIDRDLKTSFDPARQIEYDHQSYCPAVLGTRRLMALLLKSGIGKKLDEVIGLDRLAHDKGQIALRRAGNAQKASPPEPHIDGLPTPFNGAQQDILVANFTALVGVFLSPVRRKFAGNFTVWPGSHDVLGIHFRDHGPDALRSGMPRIPLGEPVQLMTEPGDVVLCHYGLAHRAAINLSTDDRYAVYFRLQLREINDTNRWQFMTDIWRGWLV